MICQSQFIELTKEDTPKQSVSFEPPLNTESDHLIQKDVEAKPINPPLLIEKLSPINSPE